MGAEKVKCTLSLFLLDDGMEDQNSWIDKMETIQQEEEIITDFTMLQKENEDVKFIVVEGEKLRVYKFENNLKQIKMRNIFQVERLMVSTVKSMKNFNSFLCGDVIKGIEVYHFDNESESKKIELINTGG